MKPKLVRDNIPMIIERDGKKPVWRNATIFEMNKMLIDKLHEEIAEFQESPCLDEAADIYEVFLKMIEHWNMNIDNVKMVANNKRYIRGSFNEGIVLERIERP